MTTIIVYACKFQECAFSCTDRWSFVSHQKSCKMNLILIVRVIEKTKSHICSEKEPISSESDKMNEDGVKMGREQSWRGLIIINLPKNQRKAMKIFRFHYNQESRNRA